ncbi:cation:proton antiporter [Kiritimatiellaeota bacterium B1221]|nr:cation:proton antiporter [Kiritimatiellaeota bacterium B1221]
MEHELALNILMIIGFLTVSVFASILLQKLRFPYTIGLVVIGFIAGYLALKLDYQRLIRLDLTPATILYLILPTLIYDASINMDMKALRKNIVPILLLAILGLLLSAGIIGGLLNHFTAIGIGAALLFGALISATDPVAVISLFSEIGAPRRLVTLVDGESIFNDATAIVLFTIVLSAIHSGIDTVNVLFFNSVVNFLWVMLGGLLTGTVVGFLGAMVVRAQKNNVILQITISLIMAYVSFITADQLHVSGVMSTMAAGLMVSLLTSNQIAHENHHFMEHFWQFFSFVANSFVFLLLGLTEAHNFSDPAKLLKGFRLLLIVIPVVTFARAAVIYLLVPLYNRFAQKEKISFAYQTILLWGGLRGAVPVALVLAIPMDFPGRDTIIQITLGYILFTLLVQGTTVKSLMALLKIKPDKSYFDYHSGVSYQLNFPTEPLGDLVTSRVLSAFKTEGFFVTHSSGDPRKAYHLSRGQKHLAIDAEQTGFTITAENQQDLTYGRKTLYETLVDLDHSVSSLEKLVKSPEMSKIVKVEDSHETSNFMLSKHLNKSLISLELRSNDKNSVITELVELAVTNGLISNRDQVIKDVQDREAALSTGFEDGLAIPHTKSSNIERIILVVGIHKTGIDFGAVDGKPSRFFFLVISPKIQVGPHIQLLADISRKMVNHDRREQLLAAENADEVITILK